MSTSSPAKAGQRMLFIDNLRIVMTALVMAHHAAVPYGSGHWYYTEPVRRSLFTDVSLGFFLSVNAAYFMGFFFLLAGYFTPPSYDRKGPWQYLKDRLYRLGIPLLIFIIFLGPLLAYFGQVILKNQPTSFSRFVSTGLRYWGVETGPLWFVVMLLVFALFYMAFRWVVRRKPLAKSSALQTWAILALGILIAGLSFAIRTVSPIDRWVSLLKFIHFEPAHFPQYITLFIIGCIAYRRDWFSQLTDGMGRAWVKVAGGLLISWPVMVLVGGGADGMSYRYIGGRYWQAIMYVTWETFLCIAMIIGLTYLFRKYFNQQNRLFKALSASAFTAFIIHPFFIVAVQYALRTLHIHPVAKFVIVSLVGIPLCFLASNALRKLPGARSFLDQPKVKAA